MTLQEQYNLIKEGKGHKGIFLTEAKKQFPNMLTNPMGFEEATKILKTRGVISENYIDLKPINSFESSSKTSWENKFAKFLAEEAKVEEKKPTKEVEDIQAHGYDYKDKTNLDNQIGQEVLNGIYFEAKENPDKTLDEIRKIVAKNLAKDGQYYMKNAAFGVKGLGYKETKVEEVTGKYASSGYSDKLKKLVKESLTSQPKIEETSEPIQLNVVFKDTEDYIRAKQWFNEESDFYPSSEHDEFQTLSFEVADQADADATEMAINQELQGSDIQSWSFELMESKIGTEKDIKEIGNLGEMTASQVTKKFKVGDKIKHKKANIGTFVVLDTTKGTKVKNLNTGRVFNDLLNPDDYELVESAINEGKSSKPSLDSDLAKIDTQAGIVAMEAKLDKISEMISAKMERLSMIEEDTNLAELVDKGKMKAMQKEIKILEKRKAKMEKIYEKMTGKSYTKEIVDELETNNE